MIDVRRNYRAPARNFVTHKFSRDEFWNRSIKAFAPVLVKERAAVIRPHSFIRSFSSHILAYGDELHLGRNNSAARIVHLRHAMSCFCAQGRATQAGKL